MTSHGMTGVIGGFLLLTSCAGREFQGRIISAPSPGIAVVRAVAHQRNGALQIDGEVEKGDWSSPVVRGHLEFEGLDDMGRVVVRAQGRWGDFIARRLGRAFFRSRLPMPSSGPIETITVKPVVETQALPRSRDRQAER